MRNPEREKEKEMNLGPGIYGAKVQSWREANPRSLLKQTMESNKQANKEQIYSLFVEELQTHPDHDDFMKTILEYWFSNAYASMIIPNLPAERRVQQEKQKQERQSLITTAKEKLKEHIKREALFLLDTLLPNGKPLRATTFGECAKLGGQLNLIAKKGKPSQKVGSVLNNADLRKLQGA
jgi:hypothetical protein